MDNKISCEIFIDKPSELEHERTIYMWGINSDDAHIRNMFFLYLYFQRDIDRFDVFVTFPALKQVYNLYCMSV